MALSNASSSRLKSWLIPIVLIILFWIAALAGSPFRYEYSKGARYILPVLRAVDPALFPNDPLVDAYALFESVFYQVIALGFSAAHIPAEQVASVMWVLYIIARLMIVLGLFVLARAFTDDIWLFVLLAAWGAFQKSTLIGGVTLFLPDLTHETLAFVMGLFALYFLITGKELHFWILAALGLFVHSLIALHLALIVVPVLLLQRRINRWIIIGGVFFALCLLMYVLFMTPPPMSAEEANLFLLMKGEMGHISPFAQAPLNWARFVILVGFALLAHLRISRDSAKHRLIAGIILSGIVVGLAIASLATVTQWLRLVQLQPMRIFYWVTFLAYLQLILVTFESLKTECMLRFLLLGVLIFVIIESPWSIPLLLLGIVYLLLDIYLRRSVSDSQHRLELIGKLGFSLFCGAVALASLANAVFNLDFNTFTIHPALVAVVLLIITNLPFSKPKLQQAAFGAALLCALVIGGLWWQSYYAAREVDADWIAVQEWSRANTAKSARFITPPDAGDFHLRSLRTSYTDASSAVVWVAPLIYAELLKRQNAFMKATQDQDFDDLIDLARQWDVQYIVVSDPFVISEEPLYSVGKYAVFAVDARR